MQYAYQRSTLSTLTQSLETYMQAYLHSATELDKSALEKEQQLFESIRQFLGNNADLPQDIVLNDRRNTHFYDDIPSLSAMNTTLRLNDYLSAMALILKYSDVDKIQTNDFLQTSYRHKKDIKLRDHLSVCLDQMNKLIHDGPEITYKDLVIANQLISWQRRCKTLVTLHNSGDTILVQLTVPIVELTVEQKAAYSSINTNSPPEWFQQRPSWEKAFWRDIIQDNRLEEMLAQPQPVLNRIYPGLPNRYRHYLLTYHQQSNKLTTTNPVSRSGVLDPFELLQKSASNERNDIAFDNALQLISSELPLLITRRLVSIRSQQQDDNQSTIMIPILYQTVLSEVRGGLHPERDMRNVKKSEVDKLKMVLDKLAGINPSIKLVLIESNYPQNKYGQSSFIASARADTATREQLVSMMCQCVHSYLESAFTTHHHLSLLRQVVLLLKENKENIVSTHADKLRSLLADTDEAEVPKELILITKLMAKYIELQLMDNLPSNKKDYYADLAKTEINLVRTIGGLPYITCKSGKDRTGMIIQLADNQLVSLEENVSCVSADNELQRAAAIFLGGHDQLLASANALGCTGLKSAKEVLPSKLIAHLERTDPEAFKHVGIYADLNKKSDKCGLVLPQFISVDIILQSTLIRPLEDEAELFFLRQKESERTEEFDKRFEKITKLCPLKKPEHVSKICKQLEESLPYLIFIGDDTYQAIRTLIVKLKDVVNEYSAHPQYLALANKQANRIIETINLSVQSYLGKKKKELKSQLSKLKAQIHEDKKNAQDLEQQSIKNEKAIKKQHQAMRENLREIQAIHSEIHSAKRTFQKRNRSQEAIEKKIANAERTIHDMLKKDNFSAEDIQKVIEACVHANQYVSALCALGIRKQNRELFEACYPYADSCCDHFGASNLLDLAAKHDKGYGIFKSAVNCWGAQVKDAGIIGHLKDFDPEYTDFLVDNYLSLNDCDNAFYNQILISMCAINANQQACQRVVEQIKENVNEHDVESSGMNEVLISYPTHLKFLGISPDEPYAKIAAIAVALSNSNTDKIKRLLRKSDFDYGIQIPVQGSEENLSIYTYLKFYRENQTIFQSRLASWHKNGSHETECNLIFTKLRSTLVENTIKWLELYKRRQPDACHYVCSELLEHVLLDDMIVYGKKITDIWLKTQSSCAIDGNLLFKKLMITLGQKKICHYIISNMSWDMYSSSTTVLAYAMKSHLQVGDYKILKSMLSRCKINPELQLRSADLIILEYWIILQSRPKMHDKSDDIRVDIEEMLKERKSQKYDFSICDGYRIIHDESGMMDYLAKRFTLLKHGEIVEIIKLALQGKMEKILAKSLPHLRVNKLTDVDMMIIFTAAFYSINTKEFTADNFASSSLACLECLFEKLSTHSFKNIFRDFLTTTLMMNVASQAIELDLTDHVKLLLQYATKIDAKLDSTPLINSLSHHFENESLLKKYIDIFRQYGIEISDSGKLKERAVSYGYGTIFNDLRQSSSTNFQSSLINQYNTTMALSK